MKNLFIISILSLASCQTPIHTKSMLNYEPTQPNKYDNTTEISSHLYLKLRDLISYRDLNAIKNFFETWTSEDFNIKQYCNSDSRKNHKPGSKLYQHGNKI